ncbi:calcium-binding protein [Phenylobacterium sp.]|uniref:calcium-binding protein n=1 Tax=Phenylobacterium sp. TaxID=1871053 RepID=UPI003BAAE23A
MAVLTINSYSGFDMTRGLFPAGRLLDVLEARSYEHSIAYDNESGDYAEEDLFGFGFTYNAFDELVGGIVTDQDHYVEGLPVFSLSDADISVATWLDYVDAGDAVGELAYVFRGDDEILGNQWDDRLVGMGGWDDIWGGGGDDDIYGGAGDDYLRGEGGDDLIEGGDGHDDLHGNTGSDLIYGGWGDDWVVGGKDHDELYGEAGWDIVLGSLGDDYVSGGDGDDWVRGGQGDDEVVGGAGWDWLSGDRGADTVTGGSGADIFHTFGEAGVDRVLDFNLSEGDRVMLDFGTTYSVAQVGPDTVISMGGGGQMILVGTTLGALTPGWIFAS